MTNFKMVISGHQFYHISNNNVSLSLNTLRVLSYFQQDLFRERSTYTVSDNVITTVLRMLRYLSFERFKYNRKCCYSPLCFNLWIRFILTFDVTSFRTTSHIALFDHADRMFERWRWFQTQMVSKMFENDCIKPSHL